MTERSTQVFDETPEDLPEPVEAATERSPNRKPKSRGVLKLWRQREAMRTFLKVYRESGDKKKATQFVDRGASTIREWIHDNEPFANSVRQIERDWQEVRSGAIRGLESKAVEVLEEALNNAKKDGRLAVDVAYKVLKSGGLIEDRQITEHVGEGGGPIRVVQGIVHNRPQEAEIVEGEVRELPQSDDD